MCAAISGRVSVATILTRGFVDEERFKMTTFKKPRLLM